MKPNKLCIRTCLSVGLALLFLNQGEASEKCVSNSVENNSHKTIVLNRQELHVLSVLACRTESMMTLASFTQSHVWPHGVRDHQGRIGLFIGSSEPLIHAKDPALFEAGKSWVVLGVIAAAKYAEGSAVDPDHIAFTDSEGLNGERWYYDLDMKIARRLHRQMVDGVLKPTQAYDLIAAAWRKVSAPPELALQ